jgi:D-alanine-D-alanine ligase
MDPLRLALIMGGRSREREVSLASGREVLRHLDKSRYHTRVYDPASDLGRLVADAKDLDLAFPVLHGLYGEDGSIQGLLQLLGVPYVGSGVLASALAMDKARTKGVYRATGIPAARDLILDRRGGAEDAARRALDAIGLPLVVKPPEQGSSVGLSLVFKEEELVPALEKAWSIAPLAMAEEYVKGREFTVAVLGNNELRALPPVEIIPAQGHMFFDYSAKYEPGESRELCPAELDPDETKTISALGEAAHRALGCRGFSRTDFILKEDVFYTLETNTLPGLTAGSLLPKAAAAAGFGFSALLDEMIGLALEA